MRMRNPFGSMKSNEDARAEQEESLNAIGTTLGKLKPSPKEIVIPPASSPIEDAARRELIGISDR